MSDREIENILNDIGSRMAQLGDPASSKYFLYLEMEEGVLAFRLFQEFEDKAVWVSCFPLSDLLSELWHASLPKQWGALRFELDRDQLSAKFDYDVQYDDHTDARSVAAIKAHFGDKPLFYPSIEEARLQRYRHRAMFES